MQNINIKKNPKKHKEHRRVRSPEASTKIVEFNRKARRSLDAWAKKHNYVPKISIKK
jgi:hypothetical protein